MCNADQCPKRLSACKRFDTGMMSRNKTVRMERVYWRPPASTGTGFDQVYRRQKAVYRKSHRRKGSVTIPISLGNTLILLHHLPPRGQDHIIPTLLQYPLALFLVLRPGGLGRYIRL